MLYRAKRLVGRAVQAAAFYRFMPAGPMRSFSAVRYQYARSNWTEVVRLTRSDLRNATKFRSSGILAARAAFYTADDEIAEAVIERLLSRYPAEPRLFDLRADIRRFQGRYSDALADAERVRFLIPSSRNAVAKVMHYSYYAHTPDVADRININELRRYPRSTRLYLAAAYGCQNTRQFEQILRTWREFNEPESIVGKVVPLTIAADQAGDIDTACQLYREAIRLAAEVGIPESDSHPARSAVSPEVLTDIDDLMSASGVRYVYLGDTARSLVTSPDRQDMPPHTEVDVGVLENDWDRSSFEKMFSEDLRFAPTQQHPRASDIGAEHRSGTRVTLRKLYYEDGKLWHDHIGSRMWNTPFEIEMRRIGERLLPLPANLSTYLHEIHSNGAGPELHSAERKRNIEVTQPEYVRLNGLRRAFELVRSGEVGRAADELTAGGEIELASAIEVRRG